MASTRIKEFEPIEPDVNKWPIYQVSARRKEFIKQVIDNSYQNLLANVSDETALQDELARTLFQERARLATNRWKADPPDEDRFWSNMRKDLVRASKPGVEGEAGIGPKDLLHNIVDRYGNEILGTFDPSIYEFARIAVPFGFSRLLKTSFGERLSTQFSISDRVVLTGELEKIRELAKKHTLIMVPTHHSNIDSMIIGWAMQHLGLPAFIYGAGLNLFGIRLLAYFMNRLGAYKVDRRKKNTFYLETLKEYSRQAIHEGCHSLFFPGGTRSRSGKLEDKLKLGLLGTAMDAQYMNFVKAASNGNDPRKVIVVPVTMNYHFVLEAPVLIDEHLKRTGKELYLMENDQFSTSLKILNFLVKFLTKTSKIRLAFAPPMDLFGNWVDKRGDSYDRHDRRIDIKEYFMSGGELVHDLQRNSEYNKLLGEVIVDKYKLHNVVFSSQLVAFTAYVILNKRYAKQDVYSLIRLPMEDREIEFEEFVETAERVREGIQRLDQQQKIIAGEDLIGPIEQVIEYGFKNLGIYHNIRPLKRTKEGKVVSPDMKLLLFYHNKLVGYGLEKYV